MTPIGHAGCALAAGGIAAPIIKKVFRTPFRAQYIIAVISGLFPDIDALSLLINHSVYFGKLWYSHHMFFHSLWAGAVVSAVIALIYISGAITIRGLRNLIRKDKIPLEHRILKTIGAFVISYIAYTVHFLGDLPTPPGPWGGIAMFWPSSNMAGGWGKIYWHNWYLIYLSISFMVTFSATALLAGILSSIPVKYVRWTGYAVRAVTVIISLNFAWKTYSFIDMHSYKEMGFAKWDQLNRSLVPKKYMKDGNRYLEKATIFWRKQLIKRDDLIKLGNTILAKMEGLHSIWAPRVAMVVPSPSPETDMKLYRKLQSIMPGMEDKREGDYRVWFIRDSLPNPEFFNKGFIVYYNSSLNSFYLQMTNAMMIVFHVEERNDKGDVIRVKRVVHTSKVFVPDTSGPQLNMDKLALRKFNFWDYEKIPYNLIPRRSFSRYMNTLHGLYPSLDYTPGHISKGWKTGIAFHDGVYSEGCTVHSFGHFDIGDHLKNPYYPLWRSADRVIDINALGTKYRGSQKVWGRTVYIRDPYSLFAKQIAMNQKK